MTYTSSRQNTRISDRGLPLSIHEISAYIKKNAKFINQSHVNAFDDFDNIDDNGRMNERNETMRPVKRIGSSAPLENLPQNLDHIFGPYDLKRVAVISDVKCPANQDVSFASALLVGAIDNYDSYKTKDKIDITEKFIRKCVKDSQIAFKKNRYNQLGWTAKDLRKTVSGFSMNRELLRYLTDTMYVNIFILDIEEDRLSFVGSDPYIRYKKNIFLLKFRDDHFEVLCEEKGRTRKYAFEYTSGIVKKLMNSSYCVEKLDCNYNNSEEDVEFVIAKEGFEIDYAGSDTDTDNDELSEGLSDELSEGLSAELSNGQASNVSDENYDFDEYDEGYESDQLNDINFEEGDVENGRVENYPIVGITEAAEFTESDEEDSYGSDEESDGDSEELDENLSTLTVKELKERAKEADIDIYYRKNGKRVAKTKGMLIDDLANE